MKFYQLENALKKYSMDEILTLVRGLNRLNGNTDNFSYKKDWIYTKYHLSDITHYQSIGFVKGFELAKE